MAIYDWIIRSEPLW